MPDTGLSQFAAPASLPQSGRWEVDRLHSTVTFSVGHHQVSTFRAAFLNVSGEYDGDAGRLVGEVAVADLSLPLLDRLKQHLLTPDFFDAHRFPTLGFASTRIQQDGAALAVEGDLTLRGLTRSVSAIGVYHPQRTVQSGPHINERFGLDLTATIDRRDFGVSFNNQIAEGVTNLGWFVKIEAALELIERAEG